MGYMQTTNAWQSTRRSVRVRLEPAKGVTSAASSRTLFGRHAAADEQGRRWARIRMDEHHPLSSNG